MTCKKTLEELIEEISKLLENHRNLALQAHYHYSTLVISIIASQIKDVNYICHTLDEILDF